MKIKILLTFAVLIGVSTVFLERHYNSVNAASTSIAAAVNTSVKPTEIKSAGKVASDHLSAPISSPKKASQCSSVTGQTIVVSLSQQHLWACSAQASVYDTPVTTGATTYGDGTPTGTWAVYSKQINRHLTGSDDRGSWDDFVNYWMPFNGDYGFHDATWQTFAFGSLTEYQTGGSHGCVHLPLAAMKWLFDWSSVGTTVTIQA